MAAQLEGAARARVERPRSAVLEGRVVAVDSGPRGPALTLDRVRAAAGPPLPRRMRLYGPADEPDGARVLPGDGLRLAAQLRPPDGPANPGGADAAQRWARRGVGALGSVIHPELMARLPHREGLRPLRAVHALRARAAGRLHRHGAGGSLLAALALGDRGGLPDPVREACRRLGVSHLLAVSGLHLALLAALALRCTRPLWLRCGWADPRGPALVTAVVAAAGYALLAGFGVPVRRALTLLVALAASRWFGRSVHWSAPLAAAACWILAREPQALFEPGAQLSFAACAGLAGAARSTPGTGVGARGVLLSSATALAATAPVAAATLGSVAPWACASNAVAIPWTAGVLLPTALLGAGVAAAAPDAGAELLEAAAWLAAVTADAAVGLAELVPALPPADPSPAALAAAGLAALGTFRLRSLRGRLLGSALLAAGLAVAPPPIEGAPPRVVFLDVGQGDAALVQGRRGALLVDAGRAFPGADAGRRIVLPALRALGVERLDALALTHADLDHRGGAPAVLSALPVAELWLPDGGVSDPAFAAAVAAARRRGVRVRELRRGTRGAWLGDLHVVALWPPRAGDAMDRNDRSLVLRVSLAGARVLLPGDLEARGEAQLLEAVADLRAQVLKLPHHGSRSSSTAAFLEAVTPALAVASAPHHGAFGMPHREVRDRLRARGVALWWTGRDGAVEVALDPPLRARGWRRGARVALRAARP